MENEEHYEEIDFDTLPTAKQIKLLQPMIKYLSDCGVPSSYDDACYVQDLEDMLMNMERLCLRVGLRFDLYLGKYGWEARVSPKNGGQGALLPVERLEGKNPRFQSALFELASAINCIWGNGT